ncbi:MAG: thermostable hemolysin [Burkholderiales bacterium]|nr:thermostable hemolysin [Burkholderiales bacterium]
MSFVESVPAPWSPEAAAPCALPAATPPSGFRLHRRDDEARLATEQFIGHRLSAALRGAVGQLHAGTGQSSRLRRTCAAAGYRSAVEPLFLERYLPQPVERMLAAAAGVRIAREQVVEVGQFASRNTPAKEGG